MSQPDRPVASISLDLDDCWTYLRTHGDPAWRSRPSFLADFVPLVLDILEDAGITLTFFVVGADAAQPRHQPLLRRIVERGHEIGNHSFEHEPWLQRYDADRLVDEVSRTHQAICEATGQAPVGFRGPGYSWSASLLEILAGRGYQYDASTLPTYLGPLARAYYFWSAKLEREERDQREALFGTLRDGTRPVKAYWWRLGGGGTLLEIPVTTFPILKTPFHLSYLQYLARVSTPLALGYLRSALAACRLTNTSPSFILHPLDLLSGDQVPVLRFFPAMDQPAQRKTELFRRVLATYSGQFRLVPLRRHAEELAATPGLPVRRPEPSGPPARAAKS